MNTSDNKYASFLHARDPSIVSWNRPALDPAIRMDLCSKYSKGSMSSSDENSAEQLQVYLRIKPSKDTKNVYSKKNNNTLICNVPNSAYNANHVQEGTRIKKTYTFTNIYDAESTQKEIFNGCVKEKVLEFLNGKNSTFFTYGTSGSGKTYTLLGTTLDPGIIPRSLQYIFRTLPTISELPVVKPMPTGNVILLDSFSSKKEADIKNKLLNNTSFTDKSVHSHTFRAMQQRLSVEENSGTVDTNGVSFSVWVSFAEVYNECIYDLLQTNSESNKSRQRLRLGLDAKGNTYIKDLTYVNVSSGIEAYEILQYGMHKLNYASTSVNKHSSRSHCIFTIKLAQITSDTHLVHISHFNFCDLAGSERAKNTGNIGIRLKESHNINTSLHVLGKCITIIRDNQRNNDGRLMVPFRESKLTRLFQRALSGPEAIAMIVNITKYNDMFDETQHVLNFSAVAKNIILESDRKNIFINLKNRVSEVLLNGTDSTAPNLLQVEVLRDQVHALCCEIEKQKEAAKEKEMEIRQNLTREFFKRFNDLTEHWSTRLKDQEATLRNTYEYKLNSLEYYYKLKDGQSPKRPRYSSVIDLDSSSEDDSNNLRNELRLKTDEINKMHTLMAELQARNTSLQTENTRIGFELTTVTSALEDEKNKNGECQKQINSQLKDICMLKTLLAETEAACSNLAAQEEQTEKVTIDLIDLKTKVSDLTAVVSSQAAELQELEAEIDEKM